jgi:hypothetical protein
MLAERLPSQEHRSPFICSGSETGHGLAFNPEAEAENERDDGLSGAALLRTLQSCAFASRNEKKLGRSKKPH